MIKNALFLVVIVFAACNQQTNQSGNSTDSTTLQASSDLNQTNAVNNQDKYSGTYEYIYLGNTKDLIENHYIVIEKSGAGYSGLYYGTTDEFDQAREGYYPGFFVAPMNNLDIDGETIKFTLSIENENVYDKPVDLIIKSNEQAKKAGYKKWIQSMNFEPKTYIADYKENIITVEGMYDEKIFKKIK
jgi:hypothetical protein